MILWATGDQSLMTFSKCMFVLGLVIMGIACLLLVLYIRDSKKQKMYKERALKAAKTRKKNERAQARVVSKTTSKPKTASKSSAKAPAKKSVSSTQSSKAPARRTRSSRYE